MRQIAILVGVLVLVAAPAGADETISLTTDKAHLIQLDEDADIVLIANPEIADVAVESPRIIFVLGKKPGATSLYVLGEDGRELVSSEVVVSADGGEPEATTAAPAPPETVNVYRSLDLTRIKVRE